MWLYRALLTAPRASLGRRQRRPDAKSGGPPPTAQTFGSFGGVVGLYQGWTVADIIATDATDGLAPRGPNGRAAGGHRDPSTRCD